MCTRPSVPMTRADPPMVILPVSALRSGWRRNRQASRASSSGTVQASDPNAPFTRAVMPRPTTLLTVNQVVAAVTIAAPSRVRPIPSRRCIGSRSRALLPMARTAAPVACAATIHTATIRCPIHSTRITNALLDGGRRGRPLPPLEYPPRPLPALPFPLAGRRAPPPERERDEEPAGGVRETVLPCGRVPPRGGPLLRARVAIMPTVTRTRRCGRQTRRGSRGGLNACAGSLRRPPRAG